MFCSNRFNGQEGLNQLASNPDINLLIVDMYMPPMDGLEFIKRVKKQDTFRNIPIIAVFFIMSTLFAKVSLIGSHNH